MNGRRFGTRTAGLSTYLPTPFSFATRLPTDTHKHTPAFHSIPDDTGHRTPHLRYGCPAALPPVLWREPFGLVGAQTTYGRKRVDWQWTPDLNTARQVLVRACNPPANTNVTKRYPHAHYSPPSVCTTRDCSALRHAGPHYTQRGKRA